MTREGLIPIGEVFRIFRGSVLLKGDVMPRLGDTVCTIEGRTIGYVSDIFGKISGFYILVRLTGEELELKMGEKLYLQGRVGQAKQQL